VNIIGAIINILFSLWLGRLWGLEGIAVATVIGFFISDVVFHLFLLKRHTKLPALPILFKFILVSSLFGGFSYLGKYTLSFLPPLSWVELFFAGIVIVTSVVLFCWVFILNMDIRQKLYGMIKNRL